MRISIGTGEELKNFLVEQGATIDTEELAHRMSCFTREDVTKANLKKRLDRWFKANELKVEINNLRELLIAAGIPMGEFPFSHEAKRVLQIGLGDRFLGSWYVYQYGDSQVETYWNIGEGQQPKMRQDYLEIWSEEDRSLACIHYQPHVFNEDKGYPKCYYYGKVWELESHIAFDIVSNERPQERVFKMANHPHLQPSMVGLTMSFSCHSLLRARIWIAEREELDLGEAEVRLKRAIEDFKFLGQYGIVGFSKTR